MNIFLLQIAFICVCVVFTGRRNIGSSQLAYKLVCVVLLACLALRHTSVGSDLSRYIFHFNNCGMLSSPKEVFAEYNDCYGYYVYNYYMYRITSGNYQMFIFWTSFITLLPVVCFISKYSEDKMLSLLTYVCFGYYIFQYSGLKQAMATAVLMSAMGAIIDRRPWKFAIYVFIASLLHTPAIIFVFAYFVGRAKIGRLTFFYYFVGMTLVYLYRGPLVLLLLDSYDSIVDLTGGIEAGGKVLIMIVMIVFGALVRVPDSNDEEYTAVFRLMLVASALQVFAVYGNVFERLADYYFVFSLLYIPYICAPTSTEYESFLTPPILTISDNTKWVIKMAISAMLVGFYLTFYSNVAGVEQYRTFL